MVTIEHDGDPETNVAFVALNGSAVDADGDAVEVVWRCMNTTEVVATGAVVEVALLQGTHNCTLTVTDALGASHTDAVQITVLAEPNQPPLANAGSNQTVQNTTEVILNGTASRDPENDPLSFAWDCGNDGLQGDGEVVSVTLPACNTTQSSNTSNNTSQTKSCVHICSLRVTDSYLSASSADVEVTVVAL